MTWVIISLIYWCKNAKSFKDEYMIPLIHLYQSIGALWRDKKMNSWRILTTCSDGIAIPKIQLVHITVILLCNWFSSLRSILPPPPCSSLTCSDSLIGAQLTGFLLGEQEPCGPSACGCRMNRCPASCLYLTKSLERTVEQSYAMLLLFKWTKSVFIDSRVAHLPQTNEETYGKIKDGSKQL